MPREAGAAYFANLNHSVILTFPLASSMLLRDIWFYFRSHASFETREISRTSREVPNLPHIPPKNVPRLPTPGHGACLAAGSNERGVNVSSR